MGEQGYQASNYLVNFQTSNPVPVNRVTACENCSCNNCRNVRASAAAERNFLASLPAVWNAQVSSAAGYNAQASAPSSQSAQVLVSAGWNTQASATVSQNVQSYAVSTAQDAQASTSGRCTRCRKRSSILTLLYPKLLNQAYRRSSSYATENPASVRHLPGNSHHTYDKPTLDLLIEVLYLTGEVTYINAIKQVEQEDACSSRDSESSLECPICLENCILPVKLPCNHVFCFRCAVLYVNTKFICALCRQPCPMKYDMNPYVHGADFLPRPRWITGGRFSPDVVCAAMEDAYWRGENTFPVTRGAKTVHIKLNRMRRAEAFASTDLHVRTLTVVIPRRDF